jgi:c-di-GMP-binding flagellar brake protein YcgR
VPATRSRTEHWQRSLEKIIDRKGSIEISVRQSESKNGSDAAVSSDLVWRVRVICMRNDEVIVEQPQALGREIPLATGLELVCVLTVGQNRWMFTSRILGPATTRSADGVSCAIRMTPPEKVERCSRRSFCRVSTVGLVLPTVQVHPLVSATSLKPAEIAVRERIESMERGGAVSTDEPMVLPEVGPAFEARLMNLGGGGVGLLVAPEEAAGLEGKRRFWMTIDLTPGIPAPVGVVTRLAHTRIDSEQRVYVGMSFEFDHHPEYKRFIVDLLTGFASSLQQEQLAKSA